jgi:DNA-binding IscR family transcriptional regulator
LLARAPSAIKLVEVYRAVDEARLFGLHRDTPNPACLVGRHIQQVLVGIVDDAQLAMEASLGSRTLADVTAGVIAAESAANAGQAGR